MDVERHLISKIVAERDLTPVAEGAITASFFIDKQHRKVFETILKHKSRYGQVPTLSVLKSDHPDYKFIQVEESYDYLVDEMRKARKLALLQDALGEAVDAFESADADAVLQILSRSLSEVANVVPNIRDTDLTLTGDERLERYRSLKDLPDGLRGIPFGISVIDRATQGAQPGQLITFVGPPKAGKSTLGLLAAMAAHRYGKRPLFVGFEMSNDEQEERYDAIRAHISHSRLRGGNLQEVEWRKLEDSIREIESMQSFYLSSDAQSMTTLTGLAAKIDSLKPDIVIVDGVYMMDDELGEAKGSPQALTNITRGMKRLAQNIDLPIVETTQVLEWKMSKRQGITSNSIGYTSSFAQDSDVILGVERTDDPSVNKVKVVLARNCPPIETFLRWDWDNGTFEELESPQEDDDARPTY